MTPRITIIMAARNTAEYLPQCLDSIANQTYTDWECIIADDHSDDATKEVIEEYSSRDSRFRYVLSKGRRLNPALQTAYALRRGTLINRMDSDDHMPLDKLEVMEREWQLHGRGSVIAGGTEHFVDDGEVGDGFKRYDRWLNHVAKNNAYHEYSYLECALPSHCWLIHHEDFDAIGAFDRDIYPEDYDLFFRMRRAGYGFYGLDRVLHHWRDRSDRISRTWDEYKDNRYFDLKVKYFFELDRDATRPLAVWGAGRNGKDLIKALQEYESQIVWICDNENKIGKDIYGIRLHSPDVIDNQKDMQLLVCVSSPSAKVEIQQVLDTHSLKPIEDYFYFN